MLRPLLHCFLCLMVPFSLQANDPDWSAFAGKETLSAGTVEELAQKLTAGLTSDRDKAAVLYYWITHNVAYDTKLLNRVFAKGSSVRVTDAEIVKLKEEQVQYAFKKKRGICQNYARLFRRMALTVGLDCEFIAGQARADAARPGSLGVGHAWNAVKIDGEWGLVDATWGSGYTDKKGKFVQTFRPAYFLPKPGSFAYSHFPKEDRWQLLPDPFTKDQFMDQPAIGAGFLGYGLSDLSHSDLRIQLPKEEALALGFHAARPLGEVYCANITVGQRIPCTTDSEEGKYTVGLTAAAARNMMIGVFAEEGLLLSYRLVVR